MILPFRDPFAWPLLLEWLGERAVPGLETVNAGTYRRVTADGGTFATTVELPLPSVSMLVLEPR